jgi:hypothetical protein
VFSKFVVTEDESVTIEVYDEDPGDDDFLGRLCKVHVGCCL